jgi:microcystin-dependent protein
MSDFYLGEIRLFAMGYSPQNWLPCDGQVLQISTNAALYSLLGTRFGGNGSTTFNLPDLRGKAILGSGLSPTEGQTYNIGQTGGSETVTLQMTNIPNHNHTITADNTKGAIANVNGNFFGDAVVSLTDSTAVNLYNNDPNAPLVSLNPTVLGDYGSGLPLNNMQPFLALQYCIATSGIYPAHDDN